LQAIDGVPPLGPATGSSDEAILNRLRMLAAVDEGLGELLAELARQGQLDNTLIVAAGDHGYFYGEHGLSVERRLAYEESIRVPLVVRYPPLAPAGRTPEALVQLVDLAPTFVELAGGAPQPHHQGRSVAPLLRGETPPDWRTSVLVEYFSDTVFPRMRKLGYQAVRNERWKYIRYTEQTGFDELYDLERDPYELENLIDDSGAAGELSAMREELERLLSETVRR
jgi:N-acetylglucosamine-6-sulfatase